MTTRTHRKFKVKLEYFKPSGKWYLTETTDVELETCADTDPVYGDKVAYTPHLIGLVRRWNSEGSLPGLTSGGWEGPVVVRTVGYFTPDPNHPAVPDVFTPDEDTAPQIVYL